MSGPLDDCRCGFVPLRFDAARLAELDRAMSSAGTALAEYQEWRRARSMPPEGKATFWCFVAAQTETVLLQEHVIGWLDTLNGPLN